MKKRAARVVRRTKETSVAVELSIDGRGTYAVNTGLPFLDHMIELFAKHALFDLKLTAKGDLRVD